jgi:hypothetical protein
LTAGKEDLCESASIRGSFADYLAVDSLTRFATSSSLMEFAHGARELDFATRNIARYQRCRARLC